MYMYINTDAWIQSEFNGNMCYERGIHFRNLKVGSIVYNRYVYYKKHTHWHGQHQALPRNAYIIRIVPNTR